MERRPLTATEEELIVGYIAHAVAPDATRADRAAKDELVEAVFAVPELARIDPAVALRVVVEIAERLPAVAPQLLCNLGAGAIEDILQHQSIDITASAADWATAARTSVAFRQALQCVWWRPGENPSADDLLRRFGGPPLLEARPAPPSRSPRPRRLPVTVGRSGVVGEMLRCCSHDGAMGWGRHGGRRAPSEATRRLQVPQTVLPSEWSTGGPR